MVSDNITISGKDYNMPEVSIDPDASSYFCLSTKEVGWTGQTLNKDESSNGNVQIVMNKTLSEECKAETFSHEGYGHAYFMAINKNPDHIRIKTNKPGVVTEGNIQLKKQIIERIKETRTNMERK